LHHGTNTLHIYISMHSGIFMLRDPRWGISICDTDGVRRIQKEGRGVPTGIRHEVLRRVIRLT
jgi:hypothetical protein